MRRGEPQGRAQSSGEDRGGHVWPRGMAAKSSHASFRRGWGAFAWHRGRCGGRHHARGR